jgi:hypothetical protein
VLDDDARVLGRGITNSRSNYDVACEVALGEALINARFSLIEASSSAPASARARELVPRALRAPLPRRSSTARSSPSSASAA